MELKQHLVPKLKALRLSGILDTLDVRTQQAIGEHWSYGDFLERLLEDEVERRAQKQLALRVRRAALNTGKTLETFDFAFNPSVNRQQLYDLAARARTPAYSFTLAGALFGAVSGYALMRRYAPFESGGVWLRRAARYGLGILGVLGLYFGLDALFGLIAADETAAGYGLRFVRYAAATFWVTGLAPWLFLRLRLADAPATSETGRG